MKYRCTKILAMVGALAMASLTLLFHLVSNKALIGRWIRIVGFPGMWIGPRLFTGLRLTFRSEVLFILFLVLCCAIEGAVLGWCMDRVLIARRAGHQC